MLINFGNFMNQTESNMLLTPFFLVPLWLVACGEEDYLWPVFHNMKIFDSTITGDAAA